MKLFGLSLWKPILLLGAMLPVLAAGQATNGVLREVFRGISDGNIASLTNYSKFPDSPSEEFILTNYFECPVNYLDNYGTRLRALLTPPVTGTYYFYIASDDNGQLFLSPDDNPLHKRLIASVNSWTASREYNRETNQKSAAISLTNGVWYYIEAIQAEGGGGDNLAVAWQKPGEGPLANESLPIPATNAIPYGLGPPIIVAQPTNAIAVEGGLAAFTVKLGRALGSTFQWRCNGTNLPGETAATLLAGPFTLADTNLTFQCFITNAYGWTSTVSATLTVTPDVTPPTVLSANTLGNRDQVTLYFSEPVNMATATNAAHYQFFTNAVVLDVRPGPDAQTVLVRYAALTNTTTLVLWINQVRDLASTPNVIKSNSVIAFSTRYTALEAALRWPQREPPGPSSRNGPLTISEVMYHPPARADGRNLEFIELYNSQPWPEEIGGFRITGAIEYTFPTNAVIGANSRIVVAAVPADVQAAYGLSNVYGPFSGRLQNDGGTLRLRNHLNAVLFEMDYADDYPFPVSPDGAGHSLVLARPSYGEKDPRAWLASDWVGGSPGFDEPIVANPLRGLLINEVFAHPTAPGQGYVELFNYSGSSMNLSNCALTDDPTTNKYRFLTNFLLPALSFTVLTESQLGFSLSAGGGALYLFGPGNRQVLEAVKYGGQEREAPWGRYPDGADEWYPLAGPTPGTANAAPSRPSVVINEIMFDPITEDDDDEYIELYNPGTNAVDLSGWKLSGAIKFTFPLFTTIPPDGYLVVAANAARLRTNYANLNTNNTVGNYSGRLANGGERLRLQMPASQTLTNEFGLPVVNTFYVTVDEAVYGDGGRWGQWAAAGGSSLELVDPRADHRRAPAWAPSDETRKSAWVTIETTGLLDNGMDAADSLQILLLGAGECLVDNVEVIPAGSTNLVSNPDFENGVAGWFFQGTHCRTSLETGEGFNSQRSLHVRASARGDTGANRIRTRLGRTLNAGETATLRARVRWLAGHPQILLRLHGNYLEATGNILAARNLGTPGARNSRAAANAGPLITEVNHSPLLPGSGKSVRVAAKVSDPDGLTALFLRYRVDPATNWNSVSMAYNGAGYYSGVIPAQPSGAVVAFYLTATDGHAQPGVSRFPDDAPNRECLVRWGENPATGTLGTYRLWITQNTLSKWVGRERLSNDPLDATFVYGNSRAIYNAGATYSGSPWHSPGFSSPINSFCDYALYFPSDNRLLGDEEITLQWPGNGGGDGTRQNEQHAYWIGYQLGLPYCHRRYANFFVNGTRSGAILEDVQQPNRAMMNAWYPEHGKGDLHKMQIWFEFDDAASGFAAAGVSLGNFTTTGGAKKLARYRWNWAKRAYGNDANNYTRLYAMMDAVTTAATGEAYRRAIESVIDVDQWARHFLVEKIVGNWDSYGNGGGQNMYTYCPADSTWKMLIWDIDFAFYSGAPTDDVFNFTDAPLARIFAHPPFARAYWRAIRDAVNGPLQATRSNPVLDYRYQALVANGINTGSADLIKNFVSARREYLRGRLAEVSPAFQITSPALSSLTTNRNLIAFSGLAPIDLTSLRINGTEVPLLWTSVTNWTAYWSLSPGSNQLAITGWDAQGAALTAATAVVTIAYTGPAEQPQDFLVINEIMHQPAWPDAAFVELYNRSTSSAFDLSNWRLHGLDYVFPQGTIIQPGGFLVVTKDLAAFNAAYGASAAVVGTFNGKLDGDGETLRLETPGATPAERQVIDQVTFENVAPWPIIAPNEGASLQLIDAAQDNNRVANWAAIATNQPATPNWQYVSASGTAGSGVFYMYLQSAGDAYVDDIKLVAGSTPEVGVNLMNNGDFEAALAGTWNISANHAGSRLSTTVKHGGNASLHLVATSGGTTRDSSIWQDNSSKLTAGQTYTLSFWYLPGASGGPLTLRFSGSWIRSTVNLSTTQALRATPGAPNSIAKSLAPFPPLWLNEIAPNNLSGPGDGTGEREPWVELYNAGTNTLSLNGCWLSDNYTNLTQWAFPASATIGPRQFAKVWLDAQADQTSETEWHASFRVVPDAGSLALANISDGKTNLLHYLNYRVPGPDRSYGLYPDGNASGRRTFAFLTPGATNNPAFPPLAVVINEWLADNAGVLPDPADGHYDDWFELYNPASEPADLSGYYLSDSLTNRFLFPIPDGTVIPAGGYRLVWADDEVQQNGGPDLHVNFKLSAAGDLIALSAPDGALVDAVTCAPQTNALSQGRLPNGGASISSLAAASPGAANPPELVANRPPALAPIPDTVVAEGSLLTFTARATDPDGTNQVLAFSLGAGAPAGATLSTDGVFAWLPTEAQGGSNYVITILVADNGSPSLSDSRTFTVIVDKVNSPPSLTTTSDGVIYEGALFAFQAQAADNDWPAQSVRFSLATNAPLGANINPTNGIFSWTPAEDQGPGLYLITVLATDDGNPPLTTSQSLRVSVLESNQPPAFLECSNRVVLPRLSLSFALQAADGDLPAQALAYEFADPPPDGAALSPTGRFTWTPSDQQAATTNLITVRVTDSGEPPASATTYFWVVVGSLPKFDGAAARVNGNQISLAFQTTPGITYQVQFKNLLTDESWTNLGEPQTATGNSLNLNDTLEAHPTRFYRVIVVE